jgi:hypothetical protein
LLQPLQWGAGLGYGEVDGVYYRSQGPWPSQGPNVVLSRALPAGFGDEPANWQATSVTGASSLGALLPGTIAPNAAADLCSFDAFVNAAGQLEVHWVAHALGNTKGFRLLRSPLSDLDAKVVVAMPPAAVDAHQDSPPIHDSSTYTG